MADKTILTLYIVAPALNNYTFEVTKIQHEMSLYPLLIINPTRGVWVRCGDEKAFIVALEETLKSQQIKNVVSGLLAQIKAEAA